MRVGWKVHRLIKIITGNVTKCGLIFNIVPLAVHTFLPSVLQFLDPIDEEDFILLVKNVINSRYDIINVILVFFFMGTDDSHINPNQEKRKGDHAQQPLKPRTYFLHFQEKSLLVTSEVFFELSICQFTWNKTMQLLKRRGVEINTCKISRL